MSKKVKRLYTGFKPDNYKLVLSPDKEKMTFDGKVKISGHKTGRPSKRITLHQKDLKIIKAKATRLDKAGEIDVLIDRIQNHNSYDEVRLHSPNTLYPGKYELELEFQGKITSAMNGMYPCNFELDGKPEVIIATQFESHHAREVFPCIDEPEAKATFDLTLNTPQGEEVISNTPVKKQSTKNNLLKTTFETTPKMSTYLLAFAYGKVLFKEAKTNKGVAIRAFATPDKIDQVDFALDVAVKCLDFYSEYFDIDYPLAKSDMIALPDFASGAMENWGLVTYREQCMLVDPQNTSVGTKQYVAMVVAHELAHQWFGNLVTMKWWTDLWLNEGFASWIEYLAVDHIFPNWQMWTQFLADEQQLALKLDGLEHTHPVEVPVNHPDEIRTIFDTISYSKGASVIHMLNDYLGHDNFRDGLRNYLKKHAYSNTETLDLWQALEEVSKKPVKKFMHAWTGLSGFPLINVKVDDNKVSLSQSRFYLLSPKKSTATHWPIPVLANEDLSIDDFTKKNLTLEQTSVSKNFMINSTRSGFYRVVYDKKHRSSLADNLTSFTPVQRLGILSDALEASKAGHSDTVFALELLINLVNEDNSAVWDVISTAVNDIRSTMTTAEAEQELVHPLMQKLASKQSKRLGWNPSKNEDYFDTLLRPTVLAMMSASKDSNTEKVIDDIFSKAKSIGDLNADTRGIVLANKARRSDKALFNKLVSWHNQETNSEIRTTLASGITAFRQPELVEKALAMITTDSVRNQDVGYWVAYSLMNRHGKEIAWKWMKTNWKWLEENLGSDLSFYRFPVYASRAFIGKDFLKDFKAFFEPKRSPALDRSINQGIEIISWRTDWHERDHDSVTNFLKKIQ